MDHHSSPRASVVIPCYKQAHFLPEAVASVIAQTYPDWELIIVDDGSPDDTAVVAQRLIETYPERRIRLVRQAESGLGGAAKGGIAGGRGALFFPPQGRARALYFTARCR